MKRRLVHELQVSGLLHPMDEAPWQRDQDLVNLLVWSHNEIRQGFEDVEADGDGPALIFKP